MVYSVNACTMLCECVHDLFCVGGSTPCCVSVLHDLLCESQHELVCQCAAWFMLSVSADRAE